MSTPIKGNFPQGMWSSKGRNRFVPAGANVGIDQENPVADLHIGNGLADSNIYLDKTNAGVSNIIFKMLGTNKAFMRLAALEDLEIGTITVDDIKFSTNNAVKMIINSNGIIYFKNEGSLVFGSMGQDDVPTIITVGFVNTDYIIDGMTTGELKGTIFQNNQELKLNFEGFYFCIWSASISVAVGNKEIEGAIGLNGVRQPLSASHKVLINANEESPIAGCGIVDCQLNDLLQIVVRNETDAQDIIINHANMIVLQIAGT